MNESYEVIGEVHIREDDVSSRNEERYDPIDSQWTLGTAAAGDSQVLPVVTRKRRFASMTDQSGGMQAAMEDASVLENDFARLEELVASPPKQIMRKSLPDSISTVEAKDKSDNEEFSDNGADIDSTASADKTCSTDDTAGNGSNGSADDICSTVDAEVTDNSLVVSTGEAAEDNTVCLEHNSWEKSTKMGQENGYSAFVAVKLPVHLLVSETLSSSRQKTSTILGLFQTSR